MIIDFFSLSHISITYLTCDSITSTYIMILVFYDYDHKIYDHNMKVLDIQRYRYLLIVL